MYQPPRSSLVVYPLFLTYGIYIYISNIYIYTPNDPQFIAIIKEWGTYTGKMGISHEFLGRPVKGTGLLWVFKRVVMVQNPCLIQVIPTAMPLWA